MASVTIITKWGNSKPAVLAKGELGVDLLNQVLYTFNGTDIIEVGGGAVDWDQIDPDTIPPEIINIIDKDGDNYIDLDALVDLAGDNAEAIVQLDADLKDLAARVTQNEKDISTNKDGVKTNADAIDALTAVVGENSGKIADNAADIDGLETNIGELDGRVTQNEEDIEDLQKIVDGDLTGLVLGGTYDVPNNVVSDVTNAGTTAGISKGDTLDQHAKADNSGMYFVCEGEGTLGSLFRDSSNGEYAQNGDWLVSDGVHGWILMSFGGDHVAWGSIGGDIKNQEDLQEALATKIEEGDTLDGGRF